MSEHAFLIPLYEPDFSGLGEKRFTGHAVVKAEGVAGLYVHRSHLENSNRPWRVANVVGLDIYPGKLNSRESARSVARLLSPHIAPQVKSGEWDGKAWQANDPVGAAAFRELIELWVGRSVSYR